MLRRNKTLVDQVSTLQKLVVRQAELICELEQKNKRLDRLRAAWLRTAAAIAKEQRESNGTHHGCLDRPSSVQRKN
jgi:aspartate oxidase